MKRPRGTSTEVNLPQGTIAFPGDAAFAANNSVTVVEAAPIRRYGYTGGEVVVVSLPDGTVATIPPGIFMQGAIYSIPGADTTLVAITVFNCRTVPANVPAFDMRYVVLPK